MNLPTMPTIEITESRRLKRASAYQREGVIYVQVPGAWPVAYKREVVQTLIQRVVAKSNRREAGDQRLLQAAEAVPTRTILTVEALTAYVQQVNRETFQVPLAQVRLGQARYSRLAQMNIRTQVMTVSRFCLEAAPESALRYLIVHELAHLLEAGHTPRFWALVAQFVPDYRLQAKLIKAHHRRAVAQEAQRN